MATYEMNLLLDPEHQVVPEVEQTGQNHFKSDHPFKFKTQVKLVITYCILYLYLKYSNPRKVYVDLTTVHL